MQQCKGMTEFIPQLLMAENNCSSQTVTGHLLHPEPRGVGRLVAGSALPVQPPVPSEV